MARVRCNSPGHACRSGPTLSLPSDLRRRCAYAGRAATSGHCEGAAFNQQGLSASGPAHGVACPDALRTKSLRARSKFLRPSRDPSGRSLCRRCLGQACYLLSGPRSARAAAWACRMEDSSRRTSARLFPTLRPGCCVALQDSHFSGKLLVSEKSGLLTLESVFLLSFEL